ncbi:MAG: hypothetical protein SPL21_10045 [Fibrobacter sp.]|nr:hypothetical protein [Fibrobacter sp.]
MSELTTPIKIDIPGIGSIESADLYLKFEADKVITELEETLKNSRNARKYWRKEYLIEYKECCHHKYKRCLDKAMWCESEENRLEAIAPIFDTNKECWEYNSDYWYKWRERWLEIAEKFKPNSTAR